MESSTQATEFEAMEPAMQATVSQREQWSVESRVFQIYNSFGQITPAAKMTMLELERDEHINYLTQGLKQIAPSFVVLDSSRPWFCYWILHSIALLGESVGYELENNTIDFVSRCQDPNGGYAGGPGQMPHLATTYAAVNAIVTLGGHKALSSIDRGKLYNFLRQMKDSSGAFRMHDAGEIDVRACYTAISVASILNILDNELVKDVGNYILSCQTYEGGISGEPGSEAHGGYTFCGLATMILIEEVDRLDLARLIDWVVFRQGVECGFQGRANKLVDGCYSFWQGGTLALLQRLDLVSGERPQVANAGEEDCPANNTSEGDDTDGNSSEADETCHFKRGEQPNGSGSVEMEPFFHTIALQQYILLCAQVEGGGFRDKPGKARDFYHTCYCLSGLSVCQYSWSKDENSPPLPKAVLGPYSNLLEPVHLLYNVVLKQYNEAHEFFSGP